MIEWRPVFNKGLEKLRIEEMVIEGFTLEDLKLIKAAAIKLGISGIDTRPTVDIVYDVAMKLTIFENDIVSPDLVMDKIREYVDRNN